MAFYARAQPRDENVPILKHNLRWSVPHALECSDGKSGKPAFEVIMERNNLWNYLKDLLFKGFGPFG